MPRTDDLDFQPLPGRGSSEGDFFRAIAYHVGMELHVCVPATVVAWTPAIPEKKQPATVDVQIDFKRVRAIDNPSEVRTSKGEELVTAKTGLLAVGTRPIRRGKPYLVPSVGGDFSMRGPIAVGTTGLLVVADRSIDSWINEGGPVDPATADRHNFDDGFFLPLVYHGSNTPTIPTTAHQLGRADGSAGLEINVGDAPDLRLYTNGPNATIDAASTVKLGAAATLGAARLTDTVDASANMATFMAQVVTALNTIAAAVPVVIVTPVPPSTIGTISSASSKVVAE